MIGDLHIHSRYSYDSNMEPEKILEKCRKRGYDVVSITDHDTIEGSLEAKKYERDSGVKVLLGEEVLTDAGDILGINLVREVRSRTWLETIAEIREQGGVSILPHPFKGHENPQALARQVDLIEIWNSRCTPQQNEQARSLALALGKPATCGSDAHTYGEIGNARMTMSGLLDPGKTFDMRYASRGQKVSSYLIKDVRLRQFWKIPLHLRKLVC